MPYEVHPAKLAQLKQAYLETYGSPTFLGDYDISYIVNGQFAMDQTEDELRELVLPAMHKYAEERAARINDRSG